MSQPPNDSLADAVARNSAMVLSLPSAGMLRHHKSRFLQDGAEGLWVESVPEEQKLIEELIGNGQPCAISFKVADQKISFASKVLKLENAYAVNVTTTVTAMLVERPVNVKAAQRRHNYRVCVPATSNLKIQIWRISEHVRVKDKPLRSMELLFTLHDLSVGGIGVTLLEKQGKPPGPIPGERLRVEVTVGEEKPFLIEGRMRPARAGQNPLAVKTGVQFMRLESGLEGRQILTHLNKIINNLQLEEVRRHRIAQG